MNNTVKIVLITVGVLAVGGLLFLAGNVSARQGWVGYSKQFEVGSVAMPGNMPGVVGMMQGATRRGMVGGMTQGFHMGGGPAGRMGFAGRQGMIAQASDPEISAEEALDLAQTYLDQNQAGAVAEAAGFFGMHGSYHFRILVEGEFSGMLMVDGVSGDVFEGPADCQWLDQESDESAQ